MISEEDFSKIIHSCAPSQQDVTKVYSLYQEYYKEFIDDANPMIIPPDDDKEKHVELVMLYAAEWGALALGILQDECGPLQFAYSSIASSIANYSLSIAYLSISGMDLQANTLLRNLYELCILFLAVTIDDDLQNEFIKGVELEIADQHWYKHFRFRDCQKIVRQWEQAQPIKFSDVLLGTPDSLYKHLSSLVHNQFVALFVFNRSRAERPNDVMTPNVWGNPATRKEPILKLMCDLLNYVNICFLSLLKNNKTLAEKLSIPQKIHDDNLVKRYNFFSRIANLYYLYYFV